MIQQLISAINTHIYLSMTSTLIALIVGVPLGIILFYQARLRPIGLAIVNTFQTIPSLALLAFLIPFVGIGAKPTIITLCIYALLPIVRGTLMGCQQVPDACEQAATAIGFSTWQRIKSVELPLALPAIMNGIRIAVVMNIGITTIAAFIGAGGLGTFITEGLAMNANRLILLGAIPTAILALIADNLLNQLSQLLQARERQQMRRRTLKIAWVILACCYVSFIVLRGLTAACRSGHANTVVIGSKNFTEEIILAHVIGNYLEQHSHLFLKTLLILIC